MENLATMAQHNPLPLNSNVNNSFFKRNKLRSTYAVPLPSKRLLTKSMFIRREDKIIGFLMDMGLTLKESQSIVGMLREFVYYGKVYCGAAAAADGGSEIDFWDRLHGERGICSIRTFWRGIAKLKSLGLIDSKKRNCQKNNGQWHRTTNWWLLDKLVLAVAHRLAEIGQTLSDFAHGIFGQFKNFWREIRSDEWEIDLSMEAPVKRKFL